MISFDRVGTVSSAFIIRRNEVVVCWQSIMFFLYPIVLTHSVKEELEEIIKMYYGMKGKLLGHIIIIVISLDRSDEGGENEEAMIYFLITNFELGLSL